MGQILIKNFRSRLNDLKFYTTVDENKYNIEWVFGDDVLITRTDYITFCIDEMNYLK